MKRILAIAGLIIAGCLPAAAQYQRAFGWCEQGGQRIKTNGQQSSTPVQASYPACTVTVYNGSTTTLATIFSDANHTQSLANPYTSSSTGLWFFYAANGTYDVSFSNGGITTPFTLAGYQLGSSGGGGGGGGGSVGPGTVNNLAKFATTTNVGNATCTDDGISPMACSLGVNLSTNALFTVKPNNGITGTTVNLLVARDSSGNAIVAQPTDTNNVIGVAGYGSGTTGSVSIAYSGQFPCKFDNQTAKNDWVTLGTSGQCHDAGSTEPSGIENMGRVNSVNGGAGTLAGVDWGLPDSTNTSSGGGTGIVNPCATASAVTYYPTASSTVGCDPAATLDGAGNSIFNSVTTTGTNAGYFASQQGTVPALAVPNANYLYADTSVVTAFGTALPSAPGTLNQVPYVSAVPDATHIKLGYTSNLHVTSVTTSGSIDCSSFSGATVDVKVNACIAAVIAAGGGTADARGLGGNQSIAAQITVGDGSTPVTLLLPVQGIWSPDAITNGTDCAIQQLGNTTILSENPGGGSGMQISSSSSAARLNAMYCSNSSGSIYLRLDGVKFRNQGHSTTTGVGFFYQGSFDSSSVSNVTVYDFKDTYAAEINHSCCSTTFYNFTVNGENFAGQTPLYIHGTEPSPPTNEQLIFVGLSVDAPGNGFHNILVDDTGVSHRSAIDIYGLYEEGSTTDTTTSMNSIDGVSRFAVYGAVLKAESGNTSTQVAFAITNTSNPNVILKGISMRFGASYPRTGIVNNNTTSCLVPTCNTTTDAQGNISEFSTGTSFPNAVSTTVYATSSAFGALESLTSSACETSYAPTTLSTIATTTDTGLNCLPANAIIDAVVARVTTTITAACTGWELGDATTPARFSSNNVTLTSGTTTDAAHIGTYNNTGIASATTGIWQASAAKVRITCAGGNPGAGAIRVIVYYHSPTAPTS